VTEYRKSNLARSRERLAWGRNVVVETLKPSTSLHRRLPEKGNPSIDSLAAISGTIHKRIGLHILAYTVEAT